MSYTIKTSTGTSYTIEDGTINNAFSLKLVGKNVTNYGKVFAENILRKILFFLLGTCKMQSCNSPKSFSNSLRCLITIFCFLNDL